LKSVGIEIMSGEEEETLLPVRGKSAHLFIFKATAVHILLSLSELERVSPERVSLERDEKDGERERERVWRDTPLS
jgi:hypothetical protein